MNKIAIAVLLAFSVHASANTVNNTYQVTPSDCEGVKTIAEGALASYVEGKDVDTVVTSLVFTPEVNNPGYRAMLPSILKAVKAVYLSGDTAVNEAYSNCTKDVGQYYTYYVKGK